MKYKIIALSVFVFLLSSAEATTTTQTLSFRENVMAELSKGRQVANLKIIFEQMEMLKPPIYLTYDKKPWAGFEGVAVKQKISQDSISLALLQEVALDWPTFKPSPDSDFPKGSSPAYIKEMHIKEKQAWMMGIVEEIMASTYPLKSEANWQISLSKDTNEPLMARAIFGVADPANPKAEEILISCLQSKKNQGTPRQLYCMKAIPKQRSIKGAEILIPFAIGTKKSPFRNDAIMILGQLTSQFTIAQNAFLKMIIDPKLGSYEAVVMEALENMYEEDLRRLFNPELEKKHSPVVLQRLKKVVSTSGRGKAGRTRKSF